MALKNIVLVIVLLVIALLGGFWLGGQTPTAALEKSQAQLDIAKKFAPMLPDKLSTISGKITVLLGNTIVLEPNLFSPLEELPKSRKISVTDKTNIIKFEQKDPAVYQKEVVNYRNAQKSGKQPLAVLDPYKQVKGSLADLKTGQIIIVTAGEDIKKKESFDAKEIQVTILFSRSPVLEPNPASAK